MKTNLASAVVLGTMLAVPAAAFAKVPESTNPNQPYAAADAPKDATNKNNTQKKAKKKGSDDKAKPPSESK